MTAPAKKPSPSFSETAMILAEIMKEDPTVIEKSEFDKGMAQIVINEDTNFSNSFKGLRPMKIEVLQETIEDLSIGGDKLRSGIIGVTFYQNKLQKFYNTHDEKTNGTVVFAIALKKAVAFKNWRMNEGDELQQDEINTSIYFLTCLLAKLV